MFEEITKKRRIYTESLLEDIRKEGSIQNIKYIPDDIKRVFVTARDISPEFHVKIQATCQKYIDNAVAKTINLPKESTAEEVEKVFLVAYKNGCKGVTVYRDKSRVSQVLSAECT